MRRDIYVLYYIWNVNDIDDAIIIGIYSSRRKAKKATKRAEKCKCSFSGGYLEIFDARTDRSGWLEGFISVEDALSLPECDSRPVPPHAYPHLRDISKIDAGNNNIGGLFALSHTHVYRDCGSVSEKIFGFYSSMHRAALIREHATTQPGFRDHPDGFCIKYYELNKDYFLPPDEDINMRRILANGCPIRPLAQAG